MITAIHAIKSLATLCILVSVTMYVINQPLYIMIFGLLSYGLLLLREYI